MPSKREASAARLALACSRTSIRARSQRTLHARRTSAVHRNAGAAIRVIRHGSRGRPIQSLRRTEVRSRLTAKAALTVSRSSRNFPPSPSTRTRFPQLTARRNAPDNSPSNRNSELYHQTRIHIRERDSTCTTHAAPASDRRISLCPGIESYVRPSNALAARSVVGQVDRYAPTTGHQRGPRPRHPRQPRQSSATHTQPGCHQVRALPAVRHGRYESQSRDYL